MGGRECTARGADHASAISSAVLDRRRGGAGACVAAWAGPAHAATFTVTKTADTNDGACTPSDCSLREAIGAANSNRGADTVNLPGGTFTLTIPGTGEAANATGDLDVTGSLTLNGNGSAVGGNDLDRVFDILNGANVKLLDLTIRNGTADGDGGGIDNEGTVRLNRVSIGNNVADADGDGDGDAGGFDNDGGNATSTQSQISGNTDKGGEFPNCKPANAVPGCAP